MRPKNAKGAVESLEEASPAVAAAVSAAPGPSEEPPSGSRNAMNPASADRTNKRTLKRNAIDNAPADSEPNATRHSRKEDEERRCSQHALHQQYRTHSTRHQAQRSHRRRKTVRRPPSPTARCALAASTADHTAWALNVLSAGAASLLMICSRSPCGVAGWLREHVKQPWDARALLRGWIGIKGKGGGWEVEKEKVESAGLKLQNMRLML